MIHSGQSPEWLAELAASLGIGFDAPDIAHPTQHVGRFRF